MAGREYTRGERAALVFLSKGTCYFPTCPARVLMTQDGEWILSLEIAHIRALEKGGPRYDAGFEDPDHFSNLMMLCSAHHKLIDKVRPSNYSVDLLVQWKADREGPNKDALAGLQHLTEDRLQFMISESFDQVKERLDQALEEFSSIDAEAAKLLRVLRHEFLDAAPPSALIDPDAAEMIYEAAQKLANLEDTAEALARATEGLGNLEDSVESMSDLASMIGNLPDYVAELREVVEDLKRHRWE